MSSWRRLYTIRRADKASELPRPSKRSLAMTHKAMTLEVVICPSESPEGWKDSNAKCAGCGKEIWCMPLCEGVPLKVCVKCAM